MVKNRGCAWFAAYRYPQSVMAIKGKLPQRGFTMLNRLVE